MIQSLQEHKELNYKLEFIFWLIIAYFANIIVLNFQEQYFH